MEKKEINPIFLDPKGLEKLCNVLGKNKEDFKPEENLANFMDYVMHALTRYSIKDLTKFFYKELSISDTDKFMSRYIKKDPTIRCAT